MKRLHPGVGAGGAGKRRGWWEGALKAPGWAEATDPDQPGRRRTADCAGAPAAAHKGERRARARAKGEGQTASGPDRLRSHNGVFHGASGGAAEATGEEGAAGPHPRQEAGPEPRAPPPPRTPQGAALGRQRWRRRVGPAAPGGSRRGCCAGAELCAGKKGTRAARQGGRGEGRAGESRGEAAAGEAGARAAGGRRWHGLREPRRLRSQIRNRARARGLPPPRPRPRRPRPLRPARARSCSRKKAESPQQRPRRRPERIQSGSRGAAAGCVCASVPRSRPMPGTCVKASCAQSPSHTLLSK